MKLFQSIRFKWLLVVVIAGAMIVPSAVSAAGSATLYLTGPNSVSAGQVFSMQVRLDPKQEDIDTVRINGTYPAAQLRWLGATLGSDFPSSSPNTFFDEGSGKFSIGAFRLGSGVRKAVVVATITFKARSNGDVKIVLDNTSRAISAGENRLSSALSLKISIGGKAVDKIVSEQPIALPTKIQVAETPSLASIIRVSSPTHPNPDNWYNSRNISISWESAGRAIKQSYASIDEFADSVPKTPVSANSIAQTLPRDGIWFAHVKTVFDDGTSQLANLRLQIDATPPRRPSPIAEQDLVPPTIPNAIHFATTDDSSGIAKYRIALGDRSLEQTDPVYSLPELDPGVHVATVTAIDRAGNESANNVSIEVVSVTTDAAVQQNTFAGRLAGWWETFGKPAAALFIVGLIALLLAIPWALIVVKKRKKRH